MRKNSALKWHYDADRHDQTLSESRSAGCEIVAWRFLARLPDADAVRFCLYEISDPSGHRRHPHGRSIDEEEQVPAEASPLLHRTKTNPDGDYGIQFRYAQAGSSSRRSLLLDPVSHAADDCDDDETVVDGDSDPAVVFRTLNALEIAVVANAKRFLGRKVVQRIVTGIWHGEIIFWDSLSVHATKTPRRYQPETTDIYSRLRVPKYLKSFEAFFFLIFLYLYYTVLIQRVLDRITATEVVLWIWLAAFCYDEFSEWLDAGSVFYVTDIWNVCDLIMMLLGCVFAVLSKSTTLPSLTWDDTDQSRNHRSHTTEQ